MTTNKKNKIVFSFPENELLAKDIIKYTEAEKGKFIMRKFPDGETYLRVLSKVEKKEILLVCSLHEPDSKFLSLIFLCNLLRDLKAKSICLVVPYIAYMRQDKRFNPGEALTSDYFAKLLSSQVNQIITIDPHLHRRKSMQEIYPVPCKVLHTATLIASWIKKNIPDALIIGPDEESKQWVSEVAKKSGSPFIVLKKHRLGDKNVKITIPKIEEYKDHTPVLMDDIISTAQTMITTINHLKKVPKIKSPVCIGIHGIFAGNAFEELKKSGAAKIVTCNTIPHVSNKIDISELIAGNLK